MCKGLHWKGSVLNLHAVCRCIEGFYSQVLSLAEKNGGMNCEHTHTHPAVVARVKVGLPL